MIGELFRQHLDLDYAVRDTRDRFKMHRALLLRRPTLELSGTYTCKVSTFVDEEIRRKRMTIYGKFPENWDSCLRNYQTHANSVQLYIDASLIYRFYHWPVLKERRKNRHFNYDGTGADVCSGNKSQSLAHPAPPPPPHAKHSIFALLSRNLDGAHLEAWNRDCAHLLLPCSVV